ncbi:MAG TPA: hypothetical protein VN795_00255 [Stellaceae bacterium]|nr:hypothetical protein [Stellaceae bacterium]
MAYTASLALPKSRFGVSLPLCVGLVAFITVLGSGPGLLGDPDTYWHIMAGRWIIAHHAIPHADIFSNSMAGAPWVAHEWLAETVFAPLYDRFGWNGPVLATALSFAAALAFLTRALLRYLEPVHALAGMATAWGMALPHLLARPHVLTLPVLVIWFACLAAARSENRAPPLYLALLMTLWANLHGGYVLGLLFAALFAGEALIAAKSPARRRDVIRQWAPFLALSFVACLLTPNGIDGLLLPWRLMQMKFALSALVEWQSPNFQSLQPLEIWLMLALFAALSLGLKLPWTRVAMLLLLLHMSLAHQRHAEILGLVAPLLVAESIARQLRRFRPQAASGLDDVFAGLSGRPSRAGLACALCFFAALSAVYLAHPITHAPDGYTPAAALQAAEEAHVSGPVMNDYGFGGYLIFEGIPPFIDGRADLYGDDFLKRYVDATRGVTDDLPKLLDEYHAGWTLFAANTTAVTLMDHLPGWRRLYADDTAVVHVRD